MLMALLLGCPAEWLRVPLPQGGVDALSMEDVQRDVWSLTQLDDRRPGQADHVAGVEITEQRLIQMHLLPGFGDKSYRAKAGEGLMLCGSRGGRSQKAVVVVSLDAGQGASSAASVASVVSLAKTWDTPEPPAHKPRKILYALSYREDPVKPTFVVQLEEEHFRRKMEAIRCFASQFDGADAAGEIFPTGQPLYELVETQGRHYGSLIRSPYGEPFYTEETVRMDDIVEMPVRSL